MKKFAALIAILVLCSNAYATITELGDGPTWRGDLGSTYQSWDFNTNPSAPDEMRNDFGGATLNVTGHSATTTLLPGYGARPGVWKVMMDDWMEITVNNTENTSPDSWKEIWLQVIYLDPGGDGTDPLPIITDPQWVWGDLERQPLEDLNDGYILDTYKIIIRPNPIVETISFTAIRENIYVSAVAVDTICIPEPATMCLLALGGLGLLRKRRA